MAAITTTAIAPAINLGSVQSIAIISSSLFFASPRRHQPLGAPSIARPLRERVGSSAPSPPGSKATSVLSIDQAAQPWLLTIAHRSPKSPETVLRRCRKLIAPTEQFDTTSLPLAALRS
jgi:hypothetical protein